MHGGTGRAIDWGVARQANRYGRVILAGGLTPENVARAIAEAQPFAVDVASGVEARPGKKDARALRALMREVESANRLQGEARNGANTVKAAAAGRVRSVGPGAAATAAQNAEPDLLPRNAQLPRETEEASRCRLQGHARSRSNVA